MNDPQLSPADGPTAKRLTADEAVELAERLAELSGAGLPLAPGLRAAASELPRGRLTAAMERLAAAMERGQPLDETIRAEQQNFPSHFRGLLTAGLRSGQLGPVLNEYVHFRLAADDLWRSIRLAVAYPLVLLGMLAGLCGFYLAWVVPELERVQQDFKTRATAAWNVLFRLESLLHGGNLVLGAAVIGLLAAGAWWAGATWRRRQLRRLPLLGSLWRFGGLTEFAQLLRLLVEHHIPLPEALRLTADGIRDADVAAGCRKLADRVEGGQPLSAALEGLPQFAPVLRPILAWGESHAALPAALDTTARYCARRVELQADMLRRFVPPVVIFLVAASVPVLISPLINLIQSLTGSYGLGNFSESENAAAQAAAWNCFSGCISMLLLGITVLASLRLVYAGRQSSNDVLYMLMRMVGWLLISLCMCGLLMLMAGVWGFFIWLVLLAYGGSCVFRFRQTQQTALLHLLTLSAERSLPLEPMVSAFADEQSGMVRHRVNRLAEQLRGGMSLADALDRSGRVLPRQAALAARIGLETGSLSAALDGADQARIRPSVLHGGAALGWFDFASVLIATTLTVTFVSAKILPAFGRIFSDFDMKLPPLSAAESGVLHWLFISGLLTVILALSITLMIFWGFRWMGWIQFDLPFVGRFLAPLDAAMVLRWLAVVAQCGQPFGPTLQLLAKRYPERLIRKRLRRAAADIERGADWIASLRARRLIRSTDTAVLRAATRAGNLPWALAETADSLQRRLFYRIQALTHVMLPLVIVLLGGLIGLYVVGCMLPLVRLIETLAKP